MDCAWAGMNVEIEQQICRDIIKLHIHIIEVFLKIFYLLLSCGFEKSRFCFFNLLLMYEM